MIANFEISAGPVDPPQLVQLLGPCNQKLDTDVRSTVEAHFAAHGVAVPADYWGRH